MLAPNGRVGGLHLWSELYLAEREGRADDGRTRGGGSDPAIAAVQFRWQPPGTMQPAFTPLGSMHVGASPSCMLALGYAAVTAGVADSVGDTPAFVADAYGAPRDWVLALGPQRWIVSLYPHALP